MMEVHAVSWIWYLKPLSGESSECSAESECLSVQQWDILSVNCRQWDNLNVYCPTVGQPKCLKLRQLFLQENSDHVTEVTA
jgi:hypothetical protein